MTAGDGHEGRSTIFLDTETPPASPKDSWEELRPLLMFFVYGIGVALVLAAWLLPSSAPYSDTFNLSRGLDKLMCLITGASICLGGLIFSLGRRSISDK
jgi:hypothetical protein